MLKPEFIKKVYYVKPVRYGNIILIEFKREYFDQIENQLERLNLQRIKEFYGTGQGEFFSYPKEEDIELYEYLQSSKFIFGTQGEDNLSKEDWNVIYGCQNKEEILMISEQEAFGDI